MARRNSSKKQKKGEDPAPTDAGEVDEYTKMCTFLGSHPDFERYDTGYAGCIFARKSWPKRFLKLEPEVDRAALIELIHELVDDGFKKTCEGNDNLKRLKGDHNKIFELRSHGMRIYCYRPSLKSKQEVFIIHDAEQKSGKKEADKDLLDRAVKARGALQKEWGKHGQASKKAKSR